MPSFRGDRLKARREQLDLTQSDLAGRVKAGQNQIYRYEKGESEPSTDVLARLSADLLVTSDWLLGLTDDPTPTLSENDLKADELEVVNLYRRGDWRDLVRFAVKQSIENGE